jgi:murein DD-endopeptidase MepM/ murein hydrolase activator NlpD
MSQQRQGRPRPAPTARGAGHSVGFNLLLGFLALVAASPSPALAQATPPATLQATSGASVPAAPPADSAPATVGAPLAPSATVGAPLAPSATVLTAPVATSTPRPVIVPACGPGMAGLAAGPGAPVTSPPAGIPLRPTIQTTRLPSSPTATLRPGETASPAPTRRPSAALVQELRGLTQDMVGELYRIDQDLVTAAGALRQAEADLDRLTTEIVALEAELAQKQAAMNERSAVYGTRLRAIYKFTRTSPLEEILSAHDFGDMLKRVTLLQAVARADSLLLGRLRAEYDSLQATANTLREKQQATIALKAQIEEQQRILAARREEQASAVARAQEQQSQAEAALAAQQASALAGRILAVQMQYASQLQELERQRPTPVPPTRAPATPRSAPQAVLPSTTTPTPLPTPGPGTPSPTPTRPPLVLPAGFRPLEWPVANAVVTTEFGEPTFAQVFHTGIDLAQRLYSPITAAEDGIVIACGYAVPGERTLSYGLFLVLAHDRTVSTLYGHMDDEVAVPPVKVGDTVKRGQVVGYIGLTGLTTGPHLHFEVRVGGQVYDPREFLVR